MNRLREELKNACLNVDGSEWHEHSNACRLKAKGGRIDVRLADDNLKVRRVYKEDNAYPLDAEIELKNVDSIATIEEYGDVEGIVVTNKNHERVWITSYWVGSSHAWGPHWHASVSHYGKDVNVIL